ncbi:hypothetical protein UlMin_028488 [Ulmus minor]
METDRPHLSTNSNNTSTSELFICFTSRLSSSSMKLSSKSILSPGRARESSQVSLSSSLSRRLKTSGSLKGGASPMFPTTGKKRGCAFENPEPSSPKVTCIGQVRVKTKKQGKKMRSRSKRREASFRKGEQALTGAAGSEECLPHRTQKWVHLPLTICEALRGFGAEFNCFLPCRSSCMTSEKEKEEKGVRSEDGRSCGAIFARWLVASREIELVVGEEERTERSSSQRREVFEGIEFKEEAKEIEVEEEEEEERASVCVPPKNALLLMRCRSDPVKMAALANRFWEAPVPNEEEEEEEEENEDSHKCKEAERVEKRVEVELENAEASMEDEILDNGICSNDEHLENPEVEEEIWDNGVCSNNEDRQNPEEEEKEDANLVGEEEERDDEVAEEAEANTESTEIETEEGEEKEENDVNGEEEEEVIVNQSIELAEETEFRDSIAETPDPEKVEEEENLLQILLENKYGSEEERELEKEEPENEEESFPISSMASTNSEQEPDEPNQEDEDEDEEDRSEPEYPNTREPGPNLQKENPVLPDCLLLMMCEPKLSMEVSKETWVCSTDFLRWLPERPVKKSSDEAKKPPASTKKESNLTHPAHQAVQPHRSSCSFPVQAVRQSMATMVEQKLVGSNRYEPFVLTRCKSEPMRSAAAKFAPEGSCLWKNRKLEPHRQATLGVGAAGVGF